MIIRWSFQGNPLLVKRLVVTDLVLDYMGATGVAATPGTRMIRTPFERGYKSSKAQLSLGPQS